MASNSANVFAAMPKATGALLRAPLGTALPTTVWATPVVAFEDLGYIGEDGFEQTEERNIEKKRAFGGSVVKILQTDYSLTVSFTFLESTNADVLKAIFGEDNVTVDGDGQIIVKRNKNQSPHAAWIIDVVDGETLHRGTIADGQLTLDGSVTKVHTDTIAYTVNLECFEDANGDTMTEYIATGPEPAP